MIVRFCRPEAAAIYIWHDRWILSDKSLNVLSSKTKLLNVGCGRHFHPDWVNIDLISHSPAVISHDVRAPLPFKDGSFDAVYHSHVLEHLPRALAPKFLTECYRVLRPEGVIRVVVPDLETIARLYLQNLELAVNGNREAAERYNWIILELLDQMVRDRSGGDMAKYWRLDPMPAEKFVIERLGQEVLNAISTKTGSSCVHPPEDLPVKPEDEMAFRQKGELHRWMYDRYSLRLLLQKTGFSNMQVCGATESAIPNFKGYLLDANEAGIVRKPDSLFMEAVKS